MKYGYILTHLFCLLLVGASQAQSSCPGPAPNQFSVLSQSHTEIELSWQAVVGAQSYEIRTFDGFTGTLLHTDTIFTTQYLQDGLTPGGTYDFELRSSYCEEGPFGIPAQLTAQSNIVVVDIIFQFECLDATQEGTTETEQPGSLTTIDLAQEQTGCVILSFSDPNDPGQVMSLILSTDYQNQLQVGNLMTSNPNLVLLGNGPLSGMLNSGGPRPEPLFAMEMSLEADSHPFVSVQWEQETEVSVTYCSSCEWLNIGIGLIEDSGSTEYEDDIQIFPNPTREFINVDLNHSTGILEVFDLQGKQWHQQLITADHEDDQLEIWVNNWPSGMYFLRISKPDTEPTVESFVKLSN